MKKALVSILLILGVAACAAVPVQIGLSDLVAELRHRANYERLYAQLIFEDAHYFNGRAEAFDTAADLVATFTVQSAAPSTAQPAAKAQPIPSKKR